MLDNFIIFFWTLVVGMSYIPYAQSSQESPSELSIADFSDSEDDFPLVWPTYTTLDHIHQENIDGVLELVKSHIKEGTSPHKIAVIFDVDGTLTDHSMPGLHPTKERYGSTAIVLQLIGMGVNVTISSAWNHFNETLNRLDDLKLTEKLKIHNRDEIDHGMYQSMTYHRLGLVASVQDPLYNPLYFCQKAWAPYMVYPKEQIHDVEKVIFADDSFANINVFKADVAHQSLYPQANQFDYFLLTKVEGTHQEKEINEPASKPEPTKVSEKEEEMAPPFPGLLSAGREFIYRSFEKLLASLPHIGSGQENTSNPNSSR